MTDPYGGYDVNSSLDGNALLMGAERVKACSFDGAYPIAWEGVVLEEPKGVQDRDYDTDEPKWWDDEKTKPRMSVVIKLQTTVSEGDEDTGVRSLWVKGQSQQAVVNAVRQAGAQGVKPGGYLWIEFYGEKVEPPQPGKKKRYPTKLYQARYTPPQSSGNQTLMAGDPEPTQVRQATMPAPSGRSLQEIAQQQSTLLAKIKNQTQPRQDDGEPPF